MNKGIRRFDIKYSADDREYLHGLIDQVLDEAYLTNHNLVAELEAKFAQHTGGQYSLAVNNGTSALLAIFQALRQITNRPKVLLPTNSFIACWLACVQAGFQPVLIDSDQSGLGLDLDQLEAELNSSEVAAVLVIHLGGIICNNIESVSNLCARFKSHLIEDAAHAHDSEKKNKKAGSWGLATAYSFHLTKAITGGEGGLIATSDSDFFKRLKSVRQFGCSDANPHIFDKLGGNYKMSEVQAAMILTDLRRSTSRIKRRNEIQSLYEHWLNHPQIKLISAGSEKTSNYKVMALVSQPLNRQMIEAHLESKQILMPNGVYFTPLHLQPVVSESLSSKSQFPNAEAFCKQHICLPCYPELSDSDIQFVAQTLNEVKG